MDDTKKGVTKKYGDWRDDVLAMGIKLFLPDSKFARPMCPVHGWITVGKKRINVWECSKCKFRVVVNEKHYREWIKKMNEEEARKLREKIKEWYKSRQY